MIYNKGYWFEDNEEYNKYVEDYKPKYTKEKLATLNLSKDCIWELDQDHHTLNHLSDLLLTMLLDVRKKKDKSIKVTEDDVQFLLDIANKKIQINFMR